MTRTRDRTRPVQGRPPRRRGRRRGDGRGRWVSWAAVAAPPIAILALAVTALALPETDMGEGAGNDAATLEAPDFTLPDTSGDAVDLGEAIAEGPALLYFSIGAGCDGCFVQIPEIADELEARGVELVSIMPGELEWVRAEAERLGVPQPIAVDADLAVSEAYDMLGHYGHSDVPSHSFALVSPDGEVTWERHYAEMFVPAEELLPELDAQLESIAG